MSAIRFGATTPRLHDQLGVVPEAVKAEQQNADAIARLCIAGLLTEAEAHRARQRLVKGLARKLRKAEAP